MINSKLRKLQNPGSYYQSYNSEMEDINRTIRNIS